MKNSILALMVLFTLIFSGCGGGSGGSVTTTSVTNTISGTVATGAPLQATITLCDVNNMTKTTTSDVNGSYTFDVTSMSAPFMLKASTSALNLYSYAAAKDSVANITPITTYILDKTAKSNGLSNAAAIFLAFNTNKDLLTSMNPSLGELTTPMTNNNVENFNHFTTSFAANHTGYDKFLDDLDINISQDDLIISYSGSVVLSTISDTTITLTWGANPTDLDAHLSGQKSQGDRFFINYYAPQYDENNTVYAKLESNSSTGYGPEIIKIYKAQTGTYYKYYVHHYSGTGSISNSSAVVVVKSPKGTKTFNAPSGATGSSGDVYGDVWHVFDMDQNGNITAVNQIISNQGLDAIE